MSLGSRPDVHAVIVGCGCCRDNNLIDVAGHIIFRDRHERIGQQHRGHIVSLGRLHNIGERLIEAAKVQGNKYTLSSGETSLAAAARIAAVFGLCFWFHRRSLTLRWFRCCPALSQHGQGRKVPSTWGRKASARST